MNIRILAGRLDHYAGSHNYNRELANRLAGKGHRVSVVCFEAHEDLHRSCERHEIPRWPHASTIPGIWRFSAVLDFLWCDRALRRLRLARPDVVVASEHLFLRAHAALFPGLPFAYLPHSLTIGDEIGTYGMSPLMAWTTRTAYLKAQRWAVAHAARTIRFSEYAAAAMCGVHGHRIRERLWINPPGVDAPPMDGPRHTPNRPLRMLWAGRVIDSKGLELALHAVARQLPGACRLDVLGDGPRLGKARQLVNDQRLEAAVHFHGFQPRMSEWYRGADLLLFPSRVENFSLTVLEAMSWGVPVLAMKADGRSFLNCNAEIITHEVDGFIAASERDFIERATELVADPERLVEAGQRARQTVVARFTWDRHLERYESLFRAMAPGCREGTPRGDDA